MMKRKILNISKYILIVFIIIIIVIPFWDMIINSFKSLEESSIPNLSLPNKWQIIENYKTVIIKGKLINSFKNSLIITGCSTALIIIISCLAASVFGRRKQKFIKIIFFLFIMGLITPPSFIVMTLMLKQFNMLGTYHGMILIFTATYCPLPIFLITGFVSSIPKELEEAAIIDGANAKGVFLKVTLPLLRPAIATSFIWAVIRIWNDFLFPLYILAGDTKKYTMILSLFFFKGQFTTAWNLVFTDLFLVSLPVLIIYIFAQKNIVKGLTAGAIKG